MINRLIVPALLITYCLNQPHTRTNAHTMSISSGLALLILLIVSSVSTFTFTTSHRDFLEEKSVYIAHHCRALLLGTVHVPPFYKHQSILVRSASTCISKCLPVLADETHMQFIIYANARKTSQGTSKAP